MMTPKTRAALIAAAHSFYITFLALAAGLLTSAMTAGATATPAALWAYVRVNAFGYLIAQLVAPAIRAAAAAKGTT